MEKYRIRQILLLVSLLFTVFFIGCTPIPSGLDPSEPRMQVIGRYIRSRSGDHMILVEENNGGMPVSLLGNSTGDRFVFDEFQTGDRIRIVCNNFRETSPAQTDVFECEWLEAGSIADIPQWVIENLTFKGFLDEPITVAVHRYWDDKDINIQATYRALWTYREIDTIISSEIQCAGLQLYAFPDREMTVEVLYHTERFTIEALPVISIESIVLDSGNNAKIYTQMDADSKELVTAVFDSDDGTFTAQFRWDHALKKRYQEDVHEILNSILFSVN